MGSGAIAEKRNAVVVDYENFATLEVGLGENEPELEVDYVLGFGFVKTELGPVLALEPVLVWVSAIDFDFGLGLDSDYVEIVVLELDLLSKSC